MVKRFSLIDSKLRERINHARGKFDLFVDLGEKLHCFLAVADGIGQDGKPLLGRRSQDDMVKQIVGNFQSGASCGEEVAVVYLAAQAGLQGGETPTVGHVAAVADEVLAKPHALSRIALSHKWSLSWNNCIEHICVLRYHNHRQQVYITKNETNW